jgi:hypothetical protein
MFEKVLSKNDVSHRGHQSGFLVPKNQAIGGVFPIFSKLGKNPNLKLKFQNWHTGENLDGNFIHYNNRHDEYRVTGLKAWFISAGLKNGDLIQIKKLSGCEVFLFSYLKRRQIVSSIGQKITYEDETYSALEGVLGGVVKRKRRASVLKKKAEQIYGKICLCCGFKSDKRYAGVKRDIIDFHHVNPLGRQKGPVRVRAVDLIPLCPNCHRAVHTTVPPITWRVLKKTLIPAG